MQIVDAEEHRRALGGPAQLARHTLEPAEAHLLALGSTERSEDLSLDAEATLATRREGAQRLQERPERGRALRLPALPGQPAHPAAPRLGPELFERARLPD